MDDGQPELTVVALTVEAALLPDWFEEVTAAALAACCTRMAVLEHPEAWRVRVELPAPNRAAFQRELGERWQRFQARTD